MVGFESFSADWEETRHAGLRRVPAGSEHVLLGFNRVKQPARSELWTLFLVFGSGFVLNFIGNLISLLCSDQSIVFLCPLGFFLKSQNPSLSEKS